MKQNKVSQSCSISIDKQFMKFFKLQKISLNHWCLITQRFLNISHDRRMYNTVYLINKGGCLKHIGHDINGGTIQWNMWKH